MKYNLLFFTLIFISNYSFSQILPSYHAVHHKPDGIIEDNLIIGKNWRDNNEIFVGSIGAIYLYTKTLSQDEITQNYNATKSRYGH